MRICMRMHRMCMAVASCDMHVAMAVPTGTSRACIWVHGVWYTHAHGRVRADNGPALALAFGVHVRGTRAPHATSAHTLGLRSCFIMCDGGFHLNRDRGYPVLVQFGWRSRAAGRLLLPCSKKPQASCSQHGHAHSMPSHLHIHVHAQTPSDTTSTAPLPLPQITGMAMQEILGVFMADSARMIQDAEAENAILADINHCACH